MKSKILGLLAMVLLAGSMNANAAFLYTFSSSNAGSFAFTVNNIVQPNSTFTNQITGFTVGAPINPTPNVFLALTQDRNFGFGSVRTSTGAEGLWQVIFANSLPTAVGSYSAEFGVIERTLLQNPSLVISTVPEPGTLALLGLGLAGLGLSRRRKAA